ncbi:MAG: helix-turn-helix transcriptional regulator [Myxococcaceae bacterium]
MARKAKTAHVGGDVMESIKRWKAEPEFARRFDAEFDRLQLARQLRELREARKLTQEDLAKLTGIKQSGIARIESGRFLPRLDLLQKIAAAVGMRVDVRFKRAESAHG